MTIELNPEAAHAIIVVTVAVTVYAGMEFVRRMLAMRKEHRRRMDLDNRWHELAHRMIAEGKNWKWNVEDGKDQMHTS